MVQRTAGAEVTRALERQPIRPFFAFIEYPEAGEAQILGQDFIEPGIAVTEIVRPIDNFARIRPVQHMDLDALPDPAVEMEKLHAMGVAGIAPQGLFLAVAQLLVGIEIDGLQGGVRFDRPRLKGTVRQGARLLLQCFE